MKKEIVEKTIYRARTGETFNDAKECVGYELAIAAERDIANPKIRDLASMAKEAIAILSQLLPEEEKKDDIYTRVDLDINDEIAIACFYSLEEAKEHAGALSYARILKNGRPYLKVIDTDTRGIRWIG